MHRAGAPPPHTQLQGRASGPSGTLYYYFEHTRDQHKRVLTNDGGYEVAQYGQLLYRPPSGHSTESRRASTSGERTTR